LDQPSADQWIRRLFAAKTRQKFGLDDYLQNRRPASYFLAQK